MSSIEGFIENCLDEKNYIILNDTVRTFLKDFSSDEVDTLSKLCTDRIRGLYTGPDAASDLTPLRILMFIWYSATTLHTTDTVPDVDDSVQTLLSIVAELLHADRRVQVCTIIPFILTFFAKRYHVVDECTSTTVSINKMFTLPNVSPTSRKHLMNLAFNGGSVYPSLATLISQPTRATTARALATAQKLGVSVTLPFEYPPEAGDYAANPVIMDSSSQSALSTPFSAVAAPTLPTPSAPVRLWHADDSDAVASTQQLPFSQSAAVGGSVRVPPLASPPSPLPLAPSSTAALPGSSAVLRALSVVWLPEAVALPASPPQGTVIDVAAPVSHAVPRALAGFFGRPEDTALPSPVASAASPQDNTTPALPANAPLPAVVPVAIATTAGGPEVRAAGGDSDATEDERSAPARKAAARRPKRARTAAAAVPAAAGSDSDSDLEVVSVCVSEAALRHRRLAGLCRGSVYISSTSFPDAFANRKWYLEEVARAEAALAQDIRVRRLREEEGMRPVAPADRAAAAGHGAQVKREG